MNLMNLFIDSAKELCSDLDTDGDQVTLFLKKFNVVCGIDDFDQDEEEFVAFDVPKCPKKLHDHCDVIDLFLAVCGPYIHNVTTDGDNDSAEAIFVHDGDPMIFKVSC